jgi:hypothetical protein
MATFGMIIFALGTFLTALNFYLTFLRLPVHLARGGMHENYRRVSGFPIFGSIFLWLSIPMLSSVGLRWTAAAVSLFDTGGIHWFLGTMWWTGHLGEFLHGCSDEE